MGSNPSGFKGSSRPVEQVTWIDCIEFCNKLSEIEGLEQAYTINPKKVSCNFDLEGYRLPTEAEWEYCARANQNFKYSGSDDVDDVAWFSKSSNDETQIVGQKKCNGFGVFDMSGNVWEWCWDLYGKYPMMPVIDPIGSSVSSFRVYRGGSCINFNMHPRVIDRGRESPRMGNSYLGFRLFRTIH
jgi:formylglycine-generating enzyme